MPDTPTEEGKRYISVKDAVFKYRVPDTTFRYWLRSGRLKHYRKGRITMLDEDEVEALVNSQDTVRPVE